MTATVSMLYNLMQSDIFNRRVLAQGGASAMLTNVDINEFTLAPTIAVSYTNRANNLIYISTDTPLNVSVNGVVICVVSQMLFLTGSFPNLSISNPSPTDTANVVVVVG